MNTTVQTFRALGNENRLRILCALAAGGKSVNELAKLLGRSQPVVSQHLSRLRSAGLVTHDRRPPLVYYSLNPNGAARELYDLVQRLYCAEGRLT